MAGEGIVLLSCNLYQIQEKERYYIMAWKVVRLTEEGKEIFSWAFDETQDMNDVRAVIDTNTGEMKLASVESESFYRHMVESGRIEEQQEIQTCKTIWILYDDGFDLYLYRKGDILHV